jgi:hypothetical protein
VRMAHGPGHQPVGPGILKLLLHPRPRQMTLVARDAVQAQRTFLWCHDCQRSRRQQNACNVRIWRPPAVGFGFGPSPDVTARRSVQGFLPGADGLSASSSMKCRAATLGRDQPASSANRNRLQEDLPFAVRAGARSADRSCGELPFGERSSLTRRTPRRSPSHR